MTVVDANRPRWRGQPGFFEIWFLVVLDPAAARAWWLRYTTWAPRTGAVRCTVWAAAWERDAAAPVLWGKRILSADAFAAAPDGFHVRCGDADLALDRARGRVPVAGGDIAWDLTFTPAAAPAVREPGWLHRLPAPTRVAHAQDDLRVRGHVVVGGRTVTLHDAPALQKHLWGTRRVEALWWCWCPRFDEDPRAAFEATSVRLRHDRGPRLTPVWLRTAGGTRGWWSARSLITNRVQPDGPGRLRIAAASATARVTGVAACDPRTLAGFVYRDPAGWDVHVAQSDVARCTLDVATRPHPLAAWSAPRRLTGPLAAVEFHHPDPLPGVRYVPWDGAAPPPG